MTQPIRRRTFLKSTALGGLAGAGALGGVSNDASAQSSAESSGHAAAQTCHEAARDIPVVEHADVIVCGGGPAGIAAALAAARSGASTRLIEVNGCLGGVWTAGLLSWILDHQHKTGLMKALLATLKQGGAATAYKRGISYDVEQMKLLLEQRCVEAGVRVRHHTRLVGTAREGRTIRHAITESKSGREAWSAKVFLDATGDGDLAARAGCGFDLGEPGTGRVQPMSLIALLTGLDPEKIAPFVRGLAEPKWRNPKGRLLAEMEKAGVSPSYAAPTMFYIRDDLFCMMANHEYGVSATDAGEITAATIRARAEVHRLVDGLRSLGGVWKSARIVATPEHIGVREGRRIHGLYRVTTGDLIRGARHDDAVCRVRFPVDVHSTDPDKTKAIAKSKVRAKPYDIPYRALIARDADNLLMAGRCISGDFIAHSSYRVTGNAVPMGEAAGTAAALAAKRSVLPRELAWPDVERGIETITKESA